MSNEILFNNLYRDLTQMKESEQRTQLIKLYIGLFESFKRPHYTKDEERKEIIMKNDERDEYFIKQLKELLK